jgi:nucleotide-binding universal stress UspA family protein
VDSNWPERIVVGVDRSPESREALDRALQLARRSGSTVVVVHAIGLLEEGAFVPGTDLDQLTRDACVRTGCPPELLAPPVAEDGRSVDVICRVAERVSGDLIVLGRRGAGAAGRPPGPSIPLGSSSAGVIERARVPVLVVSAS